MNEGQGSKDPSNAFCMYVARVRTNELGLNSGTERDSHSHNTSDNRMPINDVDLCIMGGVSIPTQEYRIGLLVEDGQVY